MDGTSLARLPQAPPPNGGWRVVVTAAALLSVVLGLLALSLARTQAGAHGDLEQRLRDRAEVSATMTGSIFTSIADQSRADSSKRLGGRLTREALDQQRRRGHLAYLVVTDGRGRVIGKSSGAPRRWRPSADRSLPRGREPITLSNVLAHGRSKVIEWAIPFKARDGMRVQVAGLRAKTMAEFLTQSVGKALRLHGGRTHVVDGNDRVIGSTTGAAVGTPLGDGGLAGALRRGRRGDYGKDRYFTSARVGHSPWRVVLSGTREALFTPVSGGRRWLPWAIFAALVAASCLSLFLIRRSTAHASRLNEANLELGRANEALHEAQAVGHIGSWEWDLVSDRMNWSEELHRIVGVSAAEMSKSFEGRLEYLHPDDRDRARSTLARALEDRTGFAYEERIVRADGEERIVYTRGDVVTDDRNEPVRLIGVCQDVTERRRAELAAAEAEERFRRAFEHGPVGMALLDVRGDSEGAFLHVNPSLCEIAGRDVADLLRKRWREVVHPHDVPATDETLRRLATDGAGSNSIEQRFVRPDGRLVWVNVSAALVRDGNGAPLYAVVQAQDVSERKRFEGQLQHLADHDPLTGLFNRRRFQAELERQLSASVRYRDTGAVVIIDLDQFKYVNDTLGHAAGDDLLGRVGALLRERLRATDVVARLGGDEFAVMLPRADEAEALEVANGLLQRMRDSAVALGSDGPVRLTASIGIALFGHRGAREADAALVNADIAMYQAKQNGRDRAEVIATAEIEQMRMKTHLAWSQAIRNAIESDGFVVHAQPILDLRSGEITAQELLLRMVGDDGELVPPAAFLDVAEQSGLIQAIDTWVIRRAVQLLQETRLDEQSCRLQVNVSGSSVTDPEILRVVEEEISRASIDPRNLVFEITETSAIVNIEKAKRFAEAVGRLGCSTALDDFGAGFGSFYYLKHLPFDCLKIDGEFIRNLPESRSDQLTVKAMVEIAHGLGKQVIAEFVEDPETLEMLRGYDVDYAQGYQVGKPAPFAGGRALAARPLE
jgi:diguanylate cyclase (GGDEF)-like protein/PAS domain S-box-containing protein